MVGCSLDYDLVRVLRNAAATGDRNRRGIGSGGSRSSVKIERSRISRNLLADAGREAAGHEVPGIRSASASGFDGRRIGGFDRAVRQGQGTDSNTAATLNDDFV